MKFEKSSIWQNKKLSRNAVDFFSYLDTLFGQNICSEKALHVKQKGEILRKVKKKLSPKAKTELNITAWLLPQRHRLTEYYKSLPCEMNENQKALAIRWLLERKFEENHTSSVFTDRRILNFDLTLNTVLYCYHPTLGKKGLYVCRQIIYSIWDVGDGIYEDVVSNLLKQHKTVFPGRKKADAYIQRLIDRGIVKCKIRFREYGNERLLKPQKILDLSTDVEYDAISGLDIRIKESHAIGYYQLEED